MPTYCEPWPGKTKASFWALRPVSSAVAVLTVTPGTVRWVLGRRGDRTARMAALDDQRRTAQDQRNKLVTFSIYGDTTLDTVLAMLADVEERLSHIDLRARTLSAVRRRAEVELESLQLTKGIEEAKVLL